MMNIFGGFCGHRDVKNILNFRENFLQILFSAVNNHLEVKYFLRSLQFSNFFSEVEYFLLFLSPAVLCLSAIGAKLFLSIYLIYRISSRNYEWEEKSKNFVYILINNTIA